MFDYCYWPEGLDIELKKQLDNFHHQAQMLIDGQMFLELANKILKAQVAGKYFELIILLPKGYRTLENANLFHRITQAGAKVGIIEITAFDEEVEQFSIFDNSLYYSTKRLKGEVDFTEFFFKKHQDFDNLMNVSRLVNSYSQEIKLSFTAEKYFAIKGEEISIFWESTNANSNVLTPGNLMLDTQGEERITIGEDSLLTITSKNEKSKNHEGATLTYNFVNAFPLSITSMPVSYDTSSLLKCTVSFSYIRYYYTSSVLAKEHEGTPDNAGSSKTGAADSPQALTGAFGLTGAQLDAIDAQDILNTEALALGNAQFGTSSSIPPLF